MHPKNRYIVSTKGIVIAIAILAAIGMGAVFLMGGLSAPAPQEVVESTPERVTVEIVRGSYDENQDESFVPIDIFIRLGDIVVWMNRDSVDGFNVDHTVTSDSDLFDSGLFGTDGEWEYEFMQAGEFPYHCIPHPWMTGTVIVGRS